MYHRPLQATVCALVFLLPLLGCNAADQPAASHRGSLDKDRNQNEPGTTTIIHKEPLHPQVELHTSAGVILLELDAQHAPLTVENFLRYVREGHYNHTIFHHVESGYVVLGGGYTPQLYVRRGRVPIRNEAANGLKNLRGTVAMAREPGDANSATCQFFINLVDNPELDHAGTSPDAFGYCVFGRVVKGMEVVDRIARIKVQSRAGFAKLPVKTVLIERAVELR